MAFDKLIFGRQLATAWHSFIPNKYFDSKNLLIFKWKCCEIIILLTLCTLSVNRCVYLRKIARLENLAQCLCLLPHLQRHFIKPDFVFNWFSYFIIQLSVNMWICKYQIFLTWCGVHIMRKSSFVLSLSLSGARSLAFIWLLFIWHMEQG